MSFLAAIAFDPAIRGVLVVMVAVACLFGSVYLILATNMGIRNGFLIALAALTGWTFSLGIFWTIYGIGMVGTSPTWTPTEINFDRDSTPVTEHVSQLPVTDAGEGPILSPSELLAQYEEQNPEIREQ